MLLKRLVPIFRSSYKIPLQTALILPFTLQVGLAVGLTCYFSLRSGQKTVDQMATHLTDEVSMRIQQQVAVLMETPHTVAQINVDALRLGQIDLQNAARLERHFWKQMQLFPSLRPIAFANQQGEIHAVDRLKDGTLVIRVMDESTGNRYHTYTVDEQGKRDRLIETHDETFDPRERPWYIAAVQAGEPTWTEIYPYFSSSDLAISAARPIYSETGELLGVTNATLSLAHLSSFLQELEVGHSGQTFIIERTGDLVASSTSMRSFLPAQAQAKQRLAAVDSENTTVQITAEHLLRRYGDLDAIEHREQLDFEVNGVRQIVQVTPFSDRYGLSWLIVVVVPETDFAPYIAANIRSTTLLCMIVMVGATVVAALTSQWIAQPIQRLSRSSKALAERTMSSLRWQESGQPIQAKGIYELSVLAQAHNQIEAQLKGSITALAKANEQLEIRVKQRTAELQERTNQLDQALHFEAMLRRITDKVRDSLDEEQILQTVVQELEEGLAVECCDMGLYSPDQTAFTICYEYTNLPVCKGLTLAIADSPDPFIHQQILRGLSSQFCFNAYDPLRVGDKPYATLACPLLDNQEAFGNLWLFRPKEQMFTELEVRLVEQVANQCAIAIRQSRLFQSAQAQIEELKQLHQVKDDFLNTVSHELRTPISNMKMAIHLLRIAATPERNQQYLDILQAECARETNLINDLLDLQRLESDHYSITPGLIVLQDWIPEVVSPFLTRSGDRQQRLQVEIPADLPPITSDPNVLERILAELLNNACKYTPSGGEIWLNVSHAANCSHVNPVPIALKISNTAEIPKADLSRIFEKFYRIPNTDLWKQGGTGLGLALVKKLTEQLGGTLDVESQSGQTTFTVLLTG